jgi:hypothetical protein
MNNKVVMLPCFFFMKASHTVVCLGTFLIIHMASVYSVTLPEYTVNILTRHVKKYLFGALYLLQEKNQCYLFAPLPPFPNQIDN